MAVTKLTKDNFEETVLKSALPVIIDFSATWCGPCQMLVPIIDSVAEERAGEILFCGVDVDEQPELAAAFSIEVVPTLVAVREGKVVNVGRGFMPKESILELVK